MLKANYIKRNLVFNEAGGTSRGVLYTKPSWFIKIEDEKGHYGIGECSIIPGLSIDDVERLDDKIKEVCTSIEKYESDFHHSLNDFPALRFALEMAFIGLQNKQPFQLFDNDFTKGSQAIIINGLIWMGEANEMLRRIEEKLAKGFKCLKLKVGAIDFDAELGLLAKIRERFLPAELEIRVDANGAFGATDAISKLNALSHFSIHSIEQPINAGQAVEMNALCRTSPIPIALDEELIGISSYEDKKYLLQKIQPQYIILKPSLVGGFKSSDEWISIAKELNIGWWATSALESNIGLNAIAQWVYTKDNPLRQGLGTGQVFSNNITSPLYLKGEELFYDPNTNWSNPFKP